MDKRFYVTLTSTKSEYYSEKKTLWERDCTVMYKNFAYYWDL